MPADRLQLTSLAVLIATLLGASPALATDGVLEINQTCAVETGCSSADFPGFPVTVNGLSGRSVRLTSDLIIPDENTSGILIIQPAISIDLNNFAIIRSGCEVATTGNCTPTSGFGSGVTTPTGDLPGLSVKNGTIVGMGGSGVRLGSQAEVTSVRVRWNRRDGISVGDSSTVTGNTAYQNEGSGITVGVSAIVSGNSTLQNAGDGISASQGAVVQNNAAAFNGGYGLNLGSSSGYRGNVITGNSGGTVNGGANLLSNACNGTTTCP